MLREGQAVAHYEVRERLGAGAMGEVWRALDTRLGREVALKVLPAELAGDPERVARLEREARTIAALQHPHVAGVYGLERVDGASVLAMEFVAGEDLASLLARGPLELDDALDVAHQVADGLEAAHEAGVVHRDLKPANVRVAPDGTVKLIDFGLARPSPGRPGSTAAGLTLEGVAVGTPAYMAPEQARGRVVDRSADVWALGCLLYECLAGRRAFGGESVSDVLAAVLERQPDWTALPARTPARVRALLERCLVKDPRRRLRDAGDARVELELARAGVPEPAAVAAAPRRGGLALAVGGAAVGLLAAYGLARLGLLGAAGDRASDPAAVLSPRRLRASIELPDTAFAVWPRLAPDGSAVVYAGVAPAVVGEPVPQLFVRPLDRDERVPLAGTERPETFCYSPDGAALAVCVRDDSVPSGFALVRVDLADGGPTVRIGTWPERYDASSAIAWTGNGEIVTSGEGDTLIVWDAAGVRPRRRVRIERTLESAFYQVEVTSAVGDDRHVFGRAYTIDASGFTGVVVAVDVETGLERVLVRGGEYGALHGDTLLYSSGETLYRRPFDREAFAVAGPPEPIAVGLYTSTPWQSGWFDVASDGTLVWIPGGRQGDARRLDVIAPDGTLAPFAPDRLAFDGQIATDPAGTLLTTTVVARDNLVELWGTATDRPLLRRLVASPSGDVNGGLPLPGGEELVYSVYGVERVELLRAPLADPERGLLLLERPRSAPEVGLGDVSPDGRTLLLTELGEDAVAVRAYDLRSDRLDEAPLFELAQRPSRPRWSPDGAWIAYDESGSAGGIVVREVRADRTVGPPLPVPDPPGGRAEEFGWRKLDPGAPLELALLAADRRTVWALPFEPGPRPGFGEPRLLGRSSDVDVIDIETLSGGRTLLLVMGPEERAPDRLELAVGLLEPR